MVYPCLLILISIGVMVILLTFVLPRFAGLFASLGSPLPPTTKLVMAVSDFLLGYWWVLIGVGVGGFFGCRAWLETPGGHRALTHDRPRTDRRQDHQELRTARIARLLGIQLESKVPLLDALRLTRAGGREICCSRI